MNDRRETLEALQSLLNYAAEFSAKADQEMLSYLIAMAVQEVKQALDEDPDPEPLMDPHYV